MSFGLVWAGLMTGFGIGFCIGALFAWRPRPTMAAMVAAMAVLTIVVVLTPTAETAATIEPAHDVAGMIGAMIGTLFGLRVPDTIRLAEGSYER